MRREQLDGLRVLLVEDVFEVRQIMRWMLEARGATVADASTARDGLHLVRTRPFDVVLTDLRLPDMSGEAVIRGLRSESGGRTRIAAVSGADARTLSRALELGAERAFGKPVEWQGLLRYLVDTRDAAVARSDSLSESEKS
jgi:CheY-like chemotaxis protein